MQAQLRNQIVLAERVFDFEINNLSGMQEFVDKVQTQQWSHLLELHIP